LIFGDDPGADLVDGGGGKDQIDDGAGADEIAAAAGADIIYSPLGSKRDSDVVTGGPGWDAYLRTCANCSVSLDGVANDGDEMGAESDHIDVEVVDTSNHRFRTGGQRAVGRGSDRVIGGDQASRLFTERGPDYVNPRAGKDHVDAGPGDDHVLADDGERDHIVCGRGFDTVTVDRRDVTALCERVRK